MTILVVHNHYRYSGGEDVVVAAEIAMFRKHGHEVIFYERHNKEYERLSWWGKLCFVARDIFWSQRTFNDMVRLIKAHKPDIAHVHNILFFVSPSVYDACRSCGVPVVQTIHNYRLLCANGLLYRSGRPCEDCFKTKGISAVVHRCSQGSLFSSIVYFFWLKWMRFSGVLRHKVDMFITPGEFVRSKFITSRSLNAERITVRSNFVDTPVNPREKVGNYVLFAGAVADYKGIKTLLAAWQGMTEISLKIAGEGPLFKELKEQYQNPGVEWLGVQSWEQTMAYIRQSAFVVVPSECYETFSRVIVDAYACGVPVVASRIGAVAERVIDGQTGFLFKACDVEDLKEKTRMLFKDPLRNLEMGRKALSLYRQEYGEEKNYHRTMDIYNQLVPKGSS